MAFVILFGCEAIIFGIDLALLHFCVLIKKDGGIRPNEVLATCANKVLNSILQIAGTDKFREYYNVPTFKISLLSIKNKV